MATTAALAVCLGMAAVTSISPAAASREAVQALFSRPPQKSPSGQTLLTTLALTFVHHGSGSDTKMLFVPWYLGDAAAKAAVDFCSVGVDGLPLSTTMGSCVAMLEGEFLRKVEGIAERVLDMAGALPSLEPFKLPAVGLLDSMVCPPG